MTDGSWATSRRIYARRVRGYDLRTRPVRRYRELAVELLEPKPGETVIDLACGTGASFESIVARIGPTGSLVGVDLSAEMLGVARRRAEGAGWGNVRLIEAPVEEADRGE